MKHIVNWYRRQSKSSRVVFGCALLIGVFALYGLGGAARQSLATVATPVSTPVSTPTPAQTPVPTPPTPTATPSPTPKPTNSVNTFSGLPGFPHQATSSAWTQQQTLPNSSATSVHKVWLHTTPTPQGTSMPTPQRTLPPQGTPAPAHLQ